MLYASICLFVLETIILWYSVETAKHIVEDFAPRGGPIGLDFTKVSVSAGIAGRTTFQKITDTLTNRTAKKTASYQLSHVYDCFLGTSTLLTVPRTG